MYYTPNFGNTCGALQYRAMATPNFASCFDFLLTRRGPLRRLAQALEDACEAGVLSLVRGEAGLTVVLPSDDEAEAFAHAIEGGGDAAAALVQLKARAIPLHLPDADAWRAAVVRGNGVGTRGGFRLPDPAEAPRTARKTLALADGNRLRPDERFASSHPIAVWKVVPPKDDDAKAVPWPTTGTAWHPPAPKKKGKARHRAPRVGRLELIQALATKWSRAMKTTIGSGYLPQYAADPFLSATVSLFDFLQREDTEAYRAVVSLSSPLPAVTFCIAVGLRGGLISDQALSRWWERGRPAAKHARLLDD